MSVDELCEFSNFELLINDITNRYSVFSNKNIILQSNQMQDPLKILRSTIIDNTYEYTNKNTRYVIRVNIKELNNNKLKTLLKDGYIYLKIYTDIKLELGKEYVMTYNNPLSLLDDKLDMEDISKYFSTISQIVFDIYTNMNKLMDNKYYYDVENLKQNIGICCINKKIHYIFMDIDKIKVSDDNQYSKKFHAILIIKLIIDYLHKYNNNYNPDIIPLMDSINDNTFTKDIIINYCNSAVSNNLNNPNPPQISYPPQIPQKYLSSTEITLSKPIKTFKQKASPLQNTKRLKKPNPIHQPSMYSPKKKPPVRPPFR